MENWNCLLCNDEILQQVSWSFIFSKSKAKHLCSKCESQLVLISGEKCEKCGRSFETLDSKYIIGKSCYDCIRWEEDKEWSGYLQKNHSIFTYNDFTKDVIARYKFRGDYILAKAFSPHIQEKLQKIVYDLITPIPLSNERLYERGFNQSEALIVEAGFTSINLLKRTHSEKQSKKSRADRIHIPQVFQIEEEAEITNKRILLVDDIYTTGSTLRYAAKILKSAGAQSVASLTLARG